MILDMDLNHLIGRDIVPLSLIHCAHSPCCSCMTYTIGWHVVCAGLKEEKKTQLKIIIKKVPHTMCQPVCMSCNRKMRSVHKASYGHAEDTYAHTWHGIWQRVFWQMHRLLVIVFFYETLLWPKCIYWDTLCQASCHDWTRCTLELQLVKGGWIVSAPLI